MRIVNIVLCAYNEGWGYQENLLPSYQRKLGHDVWIITTNEILDESGNSRLTDDGRYVNDEGVNVIRMKKDNFGLKKVFDNYDIKRWLEDINPHLIFFHDMHYFTIWNAIKYVKYHAECKLVVDNHEDEYNHSFADLSIKGKLVYRLCQMNARLYGKYVVKAYGVTRGRCDFIREVYGFPDSKIDLLLMGVDDEKVHYDNRKNLRKKLFEKLNLDEGDFLIVSGGKLDAEKKILELLDAFNDVSKKIPQAKLLIFGSIAKEIESAFGNKTTGESIYHLGFLNNQQIYNLFVSADLGVFPGGHSVLWEQAVGCGLPCVFIKREGMTHVDVGGNCLFLEGATSEEIKNTIHRVLSDKELYDDLKKNAVSIGMKAFSYFDIASKSIETIL